MSNTYIIEVGEAAVGIVTRESAASGYRFFASDRRLDAIEGKTFGAPRQVEKLARDLIARRPLRADGRSLAS